MTMAAEELETTGSDREESRFGDSPARGELPDASDGGTQGDAGNPRRIPAETRTRQEYASQMRQSQPIPAAERSDREAVSAAAAFHQSHDEVPVLHRASETGSGESAVEPAEPRSRSEYAAEVRGRAFHDDAGNRPERLTFEGKPVEVTHDAADGIWIEGLPGEAPKRIGEVLSEPGNERSRIQNLRAELNEGAGDIVEESGKWTDLLRDAFGNPPPTHSITYNPSPEMAVTQQERGINAGHSVEAALTLAIVGAAATRRLHEWWQGAREWRHDKKGNRPCR
jgi:hypothetical protein